MILVTFFAGGIFCYCETSYPRTLSYM